MSLPLHARWEYMDGTTGTGRENSSAALRAKTRDQAKHTADELEAREALQTVLEQPVEWL